MPAAADLASSLGYNPTQFAPLSIAQQLAQLFGGTVAPATSPSVGPWTWPGMNAVNIGGKPYNAGLLQSRLQSETPQMAMRQTVDETKTGKVRPPHANVLDVLKANWGPGTKFGGAGVQSNPLALALTQLMR